MGIGGALEQGHRAPDRQGGAGPERGLRAQAMRRADRRRRAAAGRGRGGRQGARREHDGDVDKAIHDVIEDHVRYAGAQGFATNIGGLVTAAVTIPANITGLALIQCRMVAAIAHLRGYDLDDQRVRNAILACILGEDEVKTMVRKKKLPSTPMGLATAPTHDPHLDKMIAAEVTSELLTKVAGKRIATTVGRRVPVVGGVVGAGADAYSSWQIGRYADRELRPRARR